MRIYPKDSIEQFGFPKIIQQIEKHCRSNAARKLCGQIAPIPDEEALKISLLQCNEYVNVLRTGIFFPGFNFPEISKEIELLRISNAVLEEAQLLNIREIAEVSNSILRFFKEKAQLFPALYLLQQDIPFTTVIIDSIDRVVDAQGQVKSSASKNLTRIRKELSTARRELDREFMAILNRYKKLDYVTESEETVHNGHRVLSVKAEYKRAVKGIIVGSSDTGKTTFIEPVESMELSNDVFELEQEEKREILLILKTLTAELRTNRTLIKSYFKLLTQLDFVRAKALFAQEIEGHLPQLVTKPTIQLIAARHPLLYLQNKKAGKPTIPFNLKLDEKGRILIISGPNAGGKSITLKTVGLLQMMLQSGLLISAGEDSSIGFFQFLLTDIGDSQSIEDELSTYSSRLIKMRKFVELADKNSLILIDEFGTGSDPELGGAIAEVILEEMADKKAIGIITSHYMNIKVAGERLEGVTNACMLFDDETLLPMYQLSIGQPGSSYTFQVAQKIGLQKQIVQRAKSKVKDKNLSLDLLLGKLQKEKTELSKTQQRIQEKEKQTEAAKVKYNELFEKYKELLEKRKLSRDEDNKLMELGRRLRVLMHEYEHSKDKKAVVQKFAKTAKDERLKKQETKKKKDEFTETDAQRKKRLAGIQIGAKVRVIKGKQIGIVEDITKTKARVIFGAVKSTIDINQLEAAEDK